MSDVSQTYGGTRPVPGTTDPETNRLRAVLQSMASVVEQVNRDNGWYDAERTVGDGIALLHSEISEAFDAWREHGTEDVTDHGPWPTDRCGLSRCEHKPEGYGSELADLLIRLLDQANRDGVDLAGEFKRKLDYNRTRGYRHGGRRV